MTFTSAGIYPLVQQLHALILPPLQRWTGIPADLNDRNHLADEMQLMICDAFGPLNGDDPDDQAAWTQAMISSEALAGFVPQWGCRYGTLDAEVDRTQAALMTALGGLVHEPGVYALADGTPITAAASAHLIGGVCILDLEEPPT